MSPTDLFSKLDISDLVIPAEVLTELRSVAKVNTDNMSCFDLAVHRAATYGYLLGMQDLANTQNFLPTEKQ